MKFSWYKEKRLIIAWNKVIKHNIILGYKEEIKGIKINKISFIPYWFGLGTENLTKLPSVKTWIAIEWTKNWKGIWLFNWRWFTIKV